MDNNEALQLISANGFHKPSIFANKNGFHQIFIFKSSEGCFVLKTGDHDIDYRKFKAEQLFYSFIHGKSIDFPVVKTFSSHLEKNKNYLFENYYPWGSLEEKTAIEPSVYKMLASKLVNLHSNKQNVDDLWKSKQKARIANVNKWFDEISYLFSASTQQKIREKLFQFKAITLGTKETSLIHGDLGFSNILANERAIVIIDYEWSRFDDPVCDFVKPEYSMKRKGSTSITFFEEYNKYNQIQGFSLRLAAHSLYHAIERLCLAKRYNQSTEVLERECISVINAIAEGKTIEQWIMEK